MKNIKLSLLAMTAIALLAACSPRDPELGAAPAPLPAVPPEKPYQTFDRHFDFARSESTVQQAKYDENTITALFKMNKGDQSVNNLKASDIKVTENGVSVTPFLLATDQKRDAQLAELVFLFDVTGSMVKFIASAKARISEFVKTARANHYNIRTCLSTFGDYTVKKCTRFYDLNSEEQAGELKTELSAITAHWGPGLDPGWPDLDENPMRAIIDAANAPWSQDALRFVILVTDAGFLYLPNHEGDKSNPGSDPKLWERNQVPRFGEVTQAIKSSQMKIFAVTRLHHFEMKQDRAFDGYNTPFQGEPSIVQSSGGEWFDFDQILSGKITLDTILQRILNRIESTYKITYSVDKAGLDPTLLASKRNVQVSPVNPALGQVKMISTTSSMPNGRPQYQQSWKVADNAIDANSLHVWVDDRELSRSDVVVNGGEVKFVAVPKAGAKIKFSFLYSDVTKNFRIEPLSFRGTLNPSTTKVYLNGKEAAKEDLVFEKTLEGNSSLRLADSALAAGDPYDIRKNEGLTVRVVTK